MPVPGQTAKILHDMLNHVQASSMIDDKPQLETETGISLLYNGCMGSFNSDIAFFIQYFRASGAVML